MNAIHPRLPNRGGVSGRWRELGLEARDSASWAAGPHTHDFTVISLVSSHGK